MRETPAILGTVSAAALLRDVLDELADLGQTHSLQTKMEAILSRMACHGSIRSGRQMRAEEMTRLWRELEATPHSGQCNHGRPTYVELKLSDIERPVSYTHLPCGGARRRRQPWRCRGRDG